MRNITCPADLDRLRAMSVQSGDEAARVRAHLGDRIADLERDLAAACRERDSLRKLLAEIALRLESGDINYAQGNLLAKRAREACGGEE